MTDKINHFFTEKEAGDGVVDLDQDLSWINYALVAEDLKKEIIHICAYPNQPTEIDKEQLVSELMFDGTFDMMQEVYNETYTIRDATTQEVDSLKRYLEYMKE
jgi:hypothetical protein